MYFLYVRGWLNRSRLNKTAKSSFSMCAHLYSGSLKDLGSFAFERSLEQF